MPGRYMHFDENDDGTVTLKAFDPAIMQEEQTYIIPEGFEGMMEMVPEEIRGQAMENVEEGMIHIPDNGAEA